MRIAFVQTLLETAKKDPRIMLLTGDLGFSVFEEFRQKFPAQYLNMGVAEQNMVGAAAGMAMEGLIPVVYSIVPFSTMRTFEQIRNDVCYQNLNVKIVGVGAGFSYGPYGHTHHGLEDIGILRTLSNLVILAPGDPVEVRWATKTMVSHTGPLYLRLGKAGEPVIHSNRQTFKLGRGVIIREGRDITLFTTSTFLARGTEVADALKKHGTTTRLVSMHTLKPLDEDIILESVQKTGAIFTLEEHSVIGGLGSAVAEVLAESGMSVPFKRLAVADRFTKEIGLQEYMRAANGLSVDLLVQTILNTFHDSSNH